MNEPPAVLLYKLMREIEHAADQLLRKHCGISYNRALFLLILRGSGPITQHELAVALGYSDPAVSAMLLELTKDGYVETAPSPQHRRKRLVSLTPKGREAVTRGREVLDAHFEKLLLRADIDVQQYREFVERLYQALITKMKEEQL